MLGQKTETVIRLIRQRAVPLALLVAALGIAVVIYVGNAGPGAAGGCKPQPAVAAAIDAAAQGELAALQATAGGRFYGDLGFVDATGRQMTLADFSGKPLLVNFWATWCIPCREEMPALDAVAAHYSGDQFSVVPVNLDLGSDSITKAEAFLASENLAHLPLYADPTYTAFERLKTNAVALGLPATLLLDGKGCEIAVLQGPAKWDSQDGYGVLDTLIKETKS
jgi:thiol-disulfide isomerase/thioredoxin